MKRFLNIWLLLVVALWTTACEMDKLNPSTNPEEEGYGYLTIGRVATNGDTEVGELNGSAAAASRAVVDAPESYYLMVNNVGANETTVWRGTIAEFNALDEGHLGVEPGRYKVFAYQDSRLCPSVGAAQDAPYYTGVSQEVEVVKNQTSTFRVTCRLANIKTSVELSADLKTMFDTSALAAEPLQVDLKVGAADEYYNYIFPYTSTHDAGPYVYYKDVAGPASQAGNTLTFTLTGMYYTGDPVDAMNGTTDPTMWKAVKMEKSLTGLKAAQWRKVSIDIDHNTTGDVQFIITIQNFVYDEEIVVDLTTLYADSDELGLTKEEAIPDEDEQNPAAPDVTIEGQSDLNFSINSSIYDEDAQSWTKYLKVLITPKDGTTVKQLYALFSSDNEALLANMAARGFAEGRVDLFPTNAATEYANVAADGTKLTLKAAGMDALYRYNGTHTVKLFTVDSDNRMKSTEVVITVTSSAAPVTGPQIVWLANGLPATTLLVQSGAETASANLSSTTGLTGLSVTIDSDVLTAEELGGFSLAAEMDLFNPASALMETRLRAFGFLPIDADAFAAGMSVVDMAAGDDQYRVFDPATGERKAGAVSPLQGQLSVSFSVSEFLSLLSALDNVENAQYKSTNRFIISASDESGSNSASMTINVAR
ncbi:MAG: DUF4493 domain-containing protein [Alistipes sp.]|nr:DUF4493 domain-containing protein [Alistipes sp.]